MFFIFFLNDDSRISVVSYTSELIIGMKKIGVIHSVIRSLRITFVVLLFCCYTMSFMREKIRFLLFMDDSYDNRTTKVTRSNSIRECATAVNPISNVCWWTWLTLLTKQKKIWWQIFIRKNDRKRARLYKKHRSLTVKTRSWNEKTQFFLFTF